MSGRSIRDPWDEDSCAASSHKACRAASAGLSKVGFRDQVWSGFLIAGKYAMADAVTLSMS
jgi:hypothetical protein